MQASRAKRITFDAYLSKLPEEERQALERLRKAIQTVAPNSEELISYNIPAFKYRGDYLVGMGAGKNYCSFYAMSGSLLGKFKNELVDFDQTKSAVHFTAKKPIPLKLIKAMVRERIKDIESKAGKKQTRKKIA